jgi:hypothetical protein
MAILKMGAALPSKAINIPLENRLYETTGFQ